MNSQKSENGTAKTEDLYAKIVGKKAEAKPTKEPTKSKDIDDSPKPPKVEKQVEVKQVQVIKEAEKVVANKVAETPK